MNTGLKNIPQNTHLGSGRFILVGFRVLGKVKNTIIIECLVKTFSVKERWLGSALFQRMGSIGNETTPVGLECGCQCGKDYRANPATIIRPCRNSSRTTFLGEQPNPWERLHLQDVMSRHQGTKPLRRYGRSEVRFFCSLSCSINL